MKYFLFIIFTPFNISNADFYIYHDYCYKTQKKINYVTDSINNEYQRELKAKIYGYQNVIEMEEAETFDGYLHEMVKNKNP